MFHYASPAETPALMGDLLKWFEKSENLQAFWKNLVEEKELIHFFTDQELEERGVSPEQFKQDDYVKVSSFIESPNSFDYPFFNDIILV